MTVAVSEAGQGAAMRRLIAELLPLPRSLTGDGVRATLDRIGEQIPLQRHEVPSGTRALDWTVPDEWNVREAYVADAATGERVIDWQRHRLHLVGYSEPLCAEMSFGALREHLHSLPDNPQAIPYRTSYYRRDWGFCVTERQLQQLMALGDERRYRVVIDADLAPGHLSYAESLVRGGTDGEVLLSAHVCHPQLANDNLAGVVVAIWLARWLFDQQARGRRLRYSYRLLFAPGTIGAIVWLAANRQRLDVLRHGLVLATLGDGGALHYKRSRHGTLNDELPIDRAVRHVLAQRSPCGVVRDFDPYGYDERQFCSPGFDLPIGRLTRTPHGEYAEYHSSLDDLDLIREEALDDSLLALQQIVEVLEGERVYVNVRPHGEPQLGRRGLYRAMGGYAEVEALQMALLWVLNLSDGRHGLLAIAERSGLSFRMVQQAAQLLHEHGLLALAPQPG